MINLKFDFVGFCYFIIFFGNYYYYCFQKEKGDERDGKRDD